MRYHLLTGPKRWFALALLCILGTFILAPAQIEARDVHKASQTVYDQQPPINEQELLTFLDLLPKFRAWARANHEEAHPYLNGNRPDFTYSPKAAKWVEKNGFEPRRFFCVMGRMAAALVIVEEGFDAKNLRPKDMPVVTEKEADLARKHLGKMLRAGGATARDVPITAPNLPKRIDK